MGQNERGWLVSDKIGDTIFFGGGGGLLTKKVGRGRFSGIKHEKRGHATKKHTHAQEISTFRNHVNIYNCELIFVIHNLQG